mmetsp:Transcript_158660/g.505038  ORF Transcript_158660/g.505038 Transcript_158660/m.505038 type:complete len:659 (-) Transcript_158660:369-2345(-)
MVEFRLHCELGDCPRPPACVELLAPPLGEMASFQDLVVECLAHRWVPLLRHADICRLLETCGSVRSGLDIPSVWQEVACVWKCVAPGCLGLEGGRSPRSAKSDCVPWRKVCANHEQLQRAWRGSPTSMRLDVRAELRSQKLEDLDVLIVEFLAGDSALALGHTKGAISIWQLGSFSDHAVGTPTAPLQALVMGVIQTTRRHDIQNLAVSPPPSAQPAVLLLGGSVWLAAAVGTSAYVWESSGRAEEDRPAAALSTWELRATLRHGALFTASHHAVWSVRLSDTAIQGQGQDSMRRAVTVGEDGVFRAWHFGGSAGLGGELLWQHDIGDARQAVVALLGVGGCLAAITRADQRSLQLFHTDTGVLIETICGVWPSGRSSLPQSAAYDVCNHLAIFSSIDDCGDGALALVDLSDRAAAAAAGSYAGPWGEADEASAGCAAEAAGGPWAASRVVPIDGPLAGPGRVLRLALAVPAAGVVVAVVHEGDPSVMLEVWDKTAALEGHCAGRVASARFRGRVPQFLGNPRLVAAGGRRLVLLDPAALRTKGELRLLEWRPAAKASLAKSPSESSLLASPLVSPGGSTWYVRRRSTRFLSWTSVGGGSSDQLPQPTTSAASAASPQGCGCVAGLRRLTRSLLGTPQSPVRAPHRRRPSCRLLGRGG